MNPLWMSLGIEISRLNAKLLIYALKDKAYPHPPTTLREAKHAVDSGLIVIAGGLHPGQSINKWNCCINC